MRYLAYLFSVGMLFWGCAGEDAPSRDQPRDRGRGVDGSQVEVDGGQVGVDGGQVEEGSNQSRPLNLTDEQKKALRADRAVRSRGKQIRMVGARVSKDDEVTSGSVGEEVVEIAEVDNTMLCNVVIKAPREGRGAKLGKVRDGQRQIDFDAMALKAATPVLIPGSCNGQSCFWVLMLRGQDCLDAPAHPGYVGSSMKEFMQLPPAQRRRILRTRGTCTVETPEGPVESRCTVKLNDPNADPNANIFLPVGWAGRAGDLNFRRYRNGSPMERRRSRAKRQKQ